MVRKLGNVLVTGHAGYIGSALMPLLHRRGLTPRVCDTNWFADEPLVGGTDYRDLRSADLQGVDTIIHLAGLSNEAIAKAFPIGDEADCVAAFAKSALVAGVTRFVFASSAAIYNDGETPSVESDRVAPYSGYAATKFESEQRLEALVADDFSVSVVRLASCFGWAPMPRLDLVVNRMTALALETGRVQLASDGESFRPFVHVEDAAAGLIRAAEIPVDRYAVHNIVGPNGNLSVGATIDTIVDAVWALGIEVVADPPTPLVDPRSYSVDGTAFRQLGFSPRWSMAAGVTDLLNRLRVANDETPTAVGVDRRARLDELRSTGRLDRDLRRRRSGEADATPIVDVAPLVSPAGVDGPALDRVLDAQRQIFTTSRYRLRGAHASQVEYLLAEELELDEAWEVLALRSGTDALRRALWLAGVRAGSSVVIPDVAFHAVAASVLAIGAHPVVLDISADTWNLDPQLVGFALRGRDDIRAVVAVDNFGTPADWAGLGTVCRAAGVPLIVDACESLGASRPDARVGDHADYIAMSFSFTKPIHAAGMGGALCARPAEIERVLAAPELLVHQLRLPELNAAYLVEAWPALHRNVSHLRAIYDAYEAILEPEGFEPQREVGVSTRIHAPFLVPAALSAKRDALLAAIGRAGVEARAQFPSQSVLLELGTPPPVSAEVDRRVISLPSGAGLPFERIPEIADAVLRAFATLR